MHEVMKGQCCYVECLTSALSHGNDSLAPAILYGSTPIKLKALKPTKVPTLPSLPLVKMAVKGLRRAASWSQARGPRRWDRAPIYLAHPSLHYASCLCCFVLRNAQACAEQPNGSRLKRLVWGKRKEGRACGEAGKSEVKITGGRRRSPARGCTLCLEDARLALLSRVLLSMLLSESGVEEDVKEKERCEGSTRKGARTLMAAWQ